MPAAFEVPASGTIEYQQAGGSPAENRAVTHHVIASEREPGSKWMREAIPGAPFVQKKRPCKEEPARDERSTENGSAATELLVGFNWQLFYYLDQPEVPPAGTRIECTAHFDNSANHTLAIRILAPRCAGPARAGKRC